MNHVRVANNSAYFNLSNVCNTRNCAALWPKIVISSLQESGKQLKTHLPERMILVLKFP